MAARVAAALPFLEMRVTLHMGFLLVGFELSAHPDEICEEQLQEEVVRSPAGSKQPRTLTCEQNYLVKAGQATPLPPPKCL
mmetsp:Transcript_54591/g.97434  ORF Transcript_54591/g.97434 Transcript_54591/m.97434 type:complete len:81 (-) Transcript_54591:16-258(-)